MSQGTTDPLWSRLVVYKIHMRLHMQPIINSISGANPKNDSNTLEQQEREYDFADTRDIS